MNVSAIHTAIINIIYPIGTIIQNYEDDTNPGDRIPGTVWKRLNDRFLVNEGYSGSRRFQLGNLDNPTVGGAESISISIDNLPKHTHRIRYVVPKSGGADPDTDLFDWSTSTEYVQVTFGNNEPTNYTKYENAGTYSTSSTGDNNYRHNNIPPYIKVYGWYRIS